MDTRPDEIRCKVHRVMHDTPRLIDRLLDGTPTGIGVSRELAELVGHSITHALRFGVAHSVTHGHALRFGVEVSGQHRLHPACD